MALIFLFINIYLLAFIENVPYARHCARSSGRNRREYILALKELASHGEIDNKSVNR